ncbi:uncharacterized protein LOC5501851 [Nematostella vectensis]|uniref:uncharacterized protein LOC5501851 n=1 Tax=Nematostella vectensis TaxID=45351 RepID=UPI00207714A7|nr:uncharacterized protein LOC5501851 [Nematostella vectensis]
MLCGPLSSNNHFHLKRENVLGFDAAAAMYRGWQRAQVLRSITPDVDMRSDSKSKVCDLEIEASVPVNNQVVNPSGSKEAKFRVLQKRFSSLGAIGVISESDACDRPSARSGEQRTTASGKGRNFPAQSPSTARESRVRSEVSLFLCRQSRIQGSNTSDNRVEHERPCVETPVTNYPPQGKYILSKAVLTHSNGAKVRRASVQHIGSLAKSYFVPGEEKKARKMSLPSRRTSEVIVTQGNSTIGSKTHAERYIEDCSADTELQWERLVARARSFQVLSPAARDNRPYKRIERKEDAKIIECNRVIHPVTEDGDGSEGENSDVCSEASHSSSGSSILGEAFAVIAKPIAKRSNTSPDDGKLVADSLSETPPKESVCTVDKTPVNTDAHGHLRRFSLATLRPQAEAVERMSGYSTHGALEYAKRLLGKVQEEGKTKTKKERLHDMSKALKLVLEELNRIETPDHELVSLFISLRAKIVNLKAEVKQEEGTESPEDGSAEKKALRLSTLSTDSSQTDNLRTSHSRRFSWC